MTSLAISHIGELVTWADDRPVRHDAGLVIAVIAAGLLWRSGTVLPCRCKARCA